MTEINDTERILESNRNFKENVINITKQFIKLTNHFVSEFPDLSLDRQQTTKHFENITEELIRQHTINQQPAITICGPNSSGKTAFVQHFLQIGDIFPSDVGPVTTRIVKLTYSSANTAYAHIYSSLEDRLLKKAPSKIIKLDQYFQNKESVEWENIAEILQEEFTRPENPDEITFAEWAKHFIEIGLPSPTLQLGIDMYDTPGFLSNNRDEILNKNLHELIKSIQPTLLFLYENSAISETDKTCFLSLKQALGTLENIPFFFLNTKADIISIFKNERVNVKRDVPLDKFEQVLRETRHKRYNLLREHDVITNEILGGFPDSIDKCDCFDICTVPRSMTPYIPYANLMNKRTFERIIKFAVRSDANSYQTLVDKILLSIDEYFDIVLSTTYRTKEQWEKLRDEALEWIERFFGKIKSMLPSIVETIHQNILELFDKQKESIAERAGNFIRNNDQLGFKLPPSSQKVCDFVRIAVYEEVMKVAASEAMNASLSNIDQIVNDNLLNKKKRNELLSMARRHIQFWEISGEDLNRKKFFASILTHLVRVPSRINRFFTNLRTRPYLDWYNQHTSQYELLDALDTYANLFNESKRQEYARVLLTKMRENIKEQKSLFKKNLSEWILTKQNQCISRINQSYQYAIDTMEQRKDAYRLTEEYSEKYAVAECQLIAAKDLVKFNGLKPTIFQEQLLGTGGFFNVYAAQWADKQNLAVKTVKRVVNATRDEYPYEAYMEAHYHRSITNTHQMNVVPLLYLYHQNNELYIFMPKYEKSLQKYLQDNIKTIQLDKILSFSLIIATILNDIHQNDLVHRDIKSSNILLDQNDQCYLSDFGTVKAGTWNQTIVGTFPLPPEIVVSSLLQQFNLPTVYDGKSVDIFAYGILLYELLPKKEYYRPNMDLAYEAEKLFENDRICPLSNQMKDYKQLILDCLDKDSRNRPNASMIIRRIESLIQHNESKCCTVCLEKERTVRTLPCGHKVLCQQCRDDLRDRNHNLCVICKKPMKTDIQDEINQTFYLKQ